MSHLNLLHWKINVSVREAESPFGISNKSNLIEEISYMVVGNAGKTKGWKHGYGETNKKKG